MKKSMFAFAAIIGLVFAWSSISAIPASAAGAQITYWFWKDNPDDNTIANLAAKFEKETGIHVNLMSDVTYNEFFSFLVNSIAAGTAPCAAQLNTTYLGPLINAGVLEPLNDRIAAWPGRSAVTPSLWSYVVGPDGKTQYAMPNKFLMFYLYYRKDILKAASVAAPKTQQEFVDAAKALAASAPGKQFAFADVEFCAGTQYDVAYHADGFDVDMPDGNRYQAALAAETDAPATARQPSLGSGDIPPKGGCRRGWVTLEVPADQRPGSIVWDDPLFDETRWHVN